MSEGDSSSDISSKISPWARGENLRYVEKEVLIPKIVREKAMANCSDLVKGTFISDFLSHLQDIRMSKIYIYISPVSLKTFNFLHSRGFF